VNKYREWVADAQFVEARTATGDHVYGSGTVFAYADQPTVEIERADGTRFSWVASFCTEADPKDVIPQPLRFRPQEPVNDAVNHPAHYTEHPSGVECITVTEHMGFCLGNAVKYIWRADLKNDAIEDLEKAAWYIRREIDRRKATQERAA
jgi:hypothetical protein